MLFTKSNILFFSNSLEQFYFFRKFIEPARFLNYSIICLTTNLSVKTYSLLYNIECYLVKKSKMKVSNSKLSELLYPINLSVNYDDLNELYSSIYFSIDRICKKKKIDAFFIWNGLNYGALALDEYSKNFSIKSLYFELSNIPAKIFVDNRGVNAESKLYQDISILNNYNVEEEEYISWHKEYLEHLSTRQIPQQATKRYFNYLFLLDKIFHSLIGLSIPGEYDFFKKIKSLLKPKGLIYNTRFNHKESPYVFFPTQVSSDSQVIFNSDIDNIEALRIAHEIAKSMDLALVVKIHPAENDYSQIRTIYDLSCSLNFCVVNISTTDLILNATKIITINSTVGLEGLILGKPVQFLGKSFFSKMNKQELRNYVCRYLIDIDYFSEDSVSISSFRQIINRLETEN